MMMLSIMRRRRRKVEEEKEKKKEEEKEEGKRRRRSSRRRRGRRRRRRRRPGTPSFHWSVSSRVGQVTRCFKNKPNQNKQTNKQTNKQKNHNNFPASLCTHRDLRGLGRPGYHLLEYLDAFLLQQTARKLEIPSSFLLSFLFFFSLYPGTVTTAWFPWISGNEVKGSMCPVVSATISGQLILADIP